jgi:hypothetical protein
MTKLIHTALIAIVLVSGMAPTPGGAARCGWYWGDAPAAAQPPQTPDAAVRRDRMRTFLVLRISDALSLPEEKALQISKVLRDAQDKRQALTAQRRDVERNLRAALDAPAKSDPTAIGKLVAQANDIDSQIAMIPEASFRQVQELLTPEQQARLVLLRPELQNQIQQNVERRLQRARMMNQQ